MNWKKKITTTLVAMLVWMSGGTKSLFDLAANSNHDGDHSPGDTSPSGGGAATCE